MFTKVEMQAELILDQLVVDPGTKTEQEVKNMEPQALQQVVAGYLPDEKERHQWNVAYQIKYLVTNEED